MLTKVFIFGMSRTEPGLEIPIYFESVTSKDYLIMNATGGDIVIDKKF